jgi:hypothetical protein
MRTHRCILGVLCHKVLNVLVYLRGSTSDVAFHSIVAYLTGFYIYPRAFLESLSETHMLPKFSPFAV